MWLYITALLLCLVVMCLLAYHVYAHKTPTRPKTCHSPTRVVVTALATESEENFKEVIRDTWWGPQHYFLQADPSQPMGTIYQRNDTLYIGGLQDNDKAVCLFKTMWGWHYLLRYEWDIMVRTNTGTYLQLQYLDVGQSSFFGGTLGTRGKETFVSGCNMVLSRDVVQKCVDLAFQQTQWPHVDHDDVIISRWLQRGKVTCSPLPREDWIDGDVDQLSKYCWSYRLSVPYGSTRIAKFQQLHQYLQTP
jgi:hypothetical protein